LTPTLHHHFHPPLHHHHHHRRVYIPQVCWWTSGTAYLISSLLHPSTVLIAGVFVALILGAFVQVCGSGLHAPARARVCVCGSARFQGAHPVSL
jgi:hypothetical protein